MPVEMVLAIIFISFITSILCIAAGIILILMVTQYAEYLKKQFNHELPVAIVNRGFQLAGFSIVTGLFFAYSIFFVMTRNEDFASKHWLLYDCMIGIYMLLMSFFLRSLFKQRCKMDTLLSTSPKPDESK